MSETEITYYKAFDRDLRCRGFQYAIGETYRHNGQVAHCSSGFHACRDILNVFEFYPRNELKTRVCRVKLGGTLSVGDEKVAAEEITILEEIPFSEIDSIANADAQPKCAEDVIEAFAKYFWTEIGWENFRAEFLANGDKDYENTRIQNAHAMTRFMQATAERFPAFKQLLGV